MKDTNELIAEFMGVEYVETKGALESNGYKLKKSDSDNPVWFNEYSLPYDKSWDWLMPVVKKCLTKGDDTDYWDGIYNALSTIDIKEVYAIVVEFIKWYNNNN